MKIAKNVCALKFAGVKFGLHRKECLQSPKDKNIKFKTFWVIKLQLGKKMIDNRKDILRIAY